MSGAGRAFVRVDAGRDGGPFEVRVARADEIAQLHDLEVRAYVPTEAASAARFQDRAARFPRGFWVLSEGGVLRALLCAVKSRVVDLADEGIKAEGGHDDAGRDLVILSVATEPAHRKRGLAGHLLDVFIANAHTLDVERIRLLCKPHLVPFYARHGFRSVGPSGSRYGGVAWIEMEQPVRRACNSRASS